MFQKLDKSKLKNLGKALTEPANEGLNRGAVAKKACAEPGVDDCPPGRGFDQQAVVAAAQRCPVVSFRRDGISQLLVWHARVGSKERRQWRRPGRR